MCRALRELMKDEIEAEVKEQVKEQVEQQVKERVNRVNNLILKLSQKGRIDDIIKAASDKTYQEQLLLEFGL